MTIDYVAISVYALPLVLVLLAYLRRRRSREARNLMELEQAREHGLDVPASLHPVIDVTRCIGCGSCVSACPEGEVLGVIDHRAVLINAADCIGHGACREACPENAIELVLGTQARGVDIPVLSAKFETSVPGIYVAGELGGMGLVKNAIEQGQQAVRSIVEHLACAPAPPGQALDLVIVGCGPAGLSAALQAKASGIRAMAIDRSCIGGTVAHFPRRKLVMTAPAKIPLVGTVKFTEIEKEALIEFWQRTVADHGLAIREFEEMRSIERERELFAVKTDRGCYRTRTILLALGRRGTPRTLGVPGEELAKVVYELEDPQQYAGQQLLVVGGGDSAIETALALADVAPGTVHLSYRGAQFHRAKRKNRERLDGARERAAIQIHMESQVRCIAPDHVSLERQGETVTIPNDHVIVRCGGILPTGLLDDIGVRVETRYGQS